LFAILNTLFKFLTLHFSSFGLRDAFYYFAEGELIFGFGLIRKIIFRPVYTQFNLSPLLMNGIIPAPNFDGQTN